MLAAGRSLHVLGNIGSPLTLGTQELTERLMPSKSPEEIVIAFITPVIIYREEFLVLNGASRRNKGQVARGLRDFYELVKVLTNHIGLIWQVFGQGWIGQTEFFRWQNDLLRAAKAIEIREL